MKNSRFRLTPLWAGLAVCIILFSVLAYLLTPEKPKNYPPYLAESPSPTGVKAFYTYLKDEAGLPIRIWNQPVTQLQGSKNGQLMVMIEPKQPFPKHEKIKWEHWMKKGNTILLFVSDPQAFFDLNATHNHDIDDQNTDIIGENELVGHYLGKTSSSNRLVAKNHDNILLKDSQGILSMERPYGNGRLIVLIEPDWLTNDQILNGSQLAAVIKLFNTIHPDAVWFNDYIHSSGEQPGLMDIFHGWLVALFAQGALVLLLFLWFNGKRFGPIDYPREAAIRINDERLRATAAWYIRGHLYLDALRHQEGYLRQKVESRFHISAHLDDQTFLDQLKSRLPSMKFTEWESTLQTWKTMKDKPKVSKKDYLEWAQTFQNMVKEVDGK